MPTETRQIRGQKAKPPSSVMEEVDAPAVANTKTQRVKYDTGSDSLATSSTIDARNGKPLKPEASAGEEEIEHIEPISETGRSGVAAAPAGTLLDEEDDE